MAYTSSFQHQAVEQPDPTWHVQSDGKNGRRAGNNHTDRSQPSLPPFRTLFGSPSKRRRAASESCRGGDRRPTQAKKCRHLQNPPRPSSSLDAHGEQRDGRMGFAVWRVDPSAMGGHRITGNARSTVSAERQDLPYPGIGYGLLSRMFCLPGDDAFFSRTSRYDVCELASPQDEKEYLAGGIEITEHYFDGVKPGATTPDLQDERPPQEIMQPCQTRVKPKLPPAFDDVGDSKPSAPDGSGLLTRPKSSWSLATNFTWKKLVSPMVETISSTIAEAVGMTRLHGARPIQKIQALNPFEACLSIPNQHAKQKALQEVLVKESKQLQKQRHDYVRFHSDKAQRKTKGLMRKLHKGFIRSFVEAGCAPSARLKIDDAMRKILKQSSSEANFQTLQQELKSEMEEVHEDRISMRVQNLCEAARHYSDIHRYF